MTETVNCKVILGERELACGRIDIGQILGKWRESEERIRVIILATEHRGLLTLCPLADIDMEHLS